MEGNNSPNYYFVVQSKSYKDENSKSYLWAPLFSKKGQSVRAYELMKRIKKGDVIIHYNNSVIPGISIAKADAYRCKKPDTIGASSSLWNPEGTRVDVEQYFSPYNIPKGKWISSFYKSQPYGGPIIQGGAGELKIGLAYLFTANKSLVEIILKEMETNPLSKNVAEQLRLRLSLPIQAEETNQETVIEGVEEMTQEKQNIEKIKEYITYPSILA